MGREDGVKTMREGDDSTRRTGTNIDGRQTDSNIRSIVTHCTRKLKKDAKGMETCPRMRDQGTEILRMMHHFILREQQSSW
jgi:hypothetical protein